MSFTERVREELAHVPEGSTCCRRAELSAALRLGASFRRRGGEAAGFGVVVESASGAVVRRLHRTVRALGGPRPELEAVEAGGLRRSAAYRLALPPAARGLLVELGILEQAGHPRQDVPPDLVRAECDRRAYVRGALLVAGSVSGPGRAAHLELRAPSAGVADGLQALLAASGGHGARARPHREAWRVVLKGGEALADVLAAVGAHSAFLAVDQGRLRRELRGAANRAANADRANLARAVAASGRQTERIEQLVARLGWDALDEELRAVALARIANPEATLAELGALLDPPIGKAAVHRRLERLRALGERGDIDDVDAPTGPS